MAEDDKGSRRPNTAQRLTEIELTLASLHQALAELASSRANQSGSGQLREPGRSEAEGEQDARLERLEAELDIQSSRVEAEMSAILQTVSLSSGLGALGKGLGDLVEQLAPLRNLAQTTTAAPMPPATVRRLANLRTALKAPSWESITNLGLLVGNVPYIGEAEPEVTLPSPGAEGNDDYWNGSE